MPTQRMFSVSISLDESTLDSLDSQAERRNVNRSHLVRMLVEQADKLLGAFVPRPELEQGDLTACDHSDFRTVSGLRVCNECGMHRTIKGEWKQPD